MKPFYPVVLALMLLPASPAAAGSQRIWDFAPFSTLRRVTAEKGAPANGQPLKVDAPALAQALGQVRLAVKSGEEPLFGPTEATVLARAMTEALALAQPGEDLELVSAARRGASVFDATLAVTARVFAQDGKVNLIVHDARLEFLHLYGMTNRMPELDHGSRAAAGAVVLQAPGAESRRADWIVLPASALAPAAPAEAVPVPAPPARAATVPPAGVEDRLRDLKRFRDQNLITEDEYVQHKQELLKEFMGAVNAKP